MGICTGRNFFLLICVLQVLTVVVRQIFDFLGFLWIPILLNFFDILFIILGFFGAFQYRPAYLIVYLVWHFLWLGWNVFLICLYLDVAGLNHKESIVLKLDPDSGSWWQKGPGCKVTLNVNDSFPVYENVTNCFVDYRHVEIFQSGLQCILSICGLITGFCLIRSFTEEDDSSPRKPARKNPKRMSLYSIEFSPQTDGRPDSDSQDYDHEQPPPTSPKPMTPRRVKRRSVMTRGTTSRHSTSSRRHSAARSSTRSSRRHAQNPVTRLLEQQQQNAHSQFTNSPSPIEPLPHYYHSSASNSNLMAAQAGNWQSNGHANPTYQQSSIQSLNEPDDLDELYNNRPASVRSSYSNFHGTRAISYAGHQPYRSHATPQVPQKRAANAGRQSMRSVAFLNNGPPAYSSQTHTLDSETTI